jgi:Voltage-dependent anion channel
MFPAEPATPRQRDSEGLARILAAIPAASGAVVMGTGIVSIALLLDGHETLSGVLLVLAGVAWVTLGAILADRVLRDRERLRTESRVPAALTGVAGTGVLGTRLVLLGWDWAGIVLLVIALALWLALVPSVLRNWVVPTFGASFILTVSTESLALLAAVLALGEHAHWLLDAALVPFVLGVAFYLFVLSRFEFRQLLVGRGDHWVSGGALAISTVAAGRITIAAAKLHMFTGHQALLEGIALGLWVATIAWLPVLLIAEVAKPRLHYDVRRWSTVFPFGMYAACSFIVGEAIKALGITEFAEIWVWVAVAVWLVVFAGMLRRGLQLAGGEPQPTSSDRINELATSG